jgi:hypothetical protein
LFAARQIAGLRAAGGPASFAGRAANPGEPCVAHALRIVIDPHGVLTGHSSWPANPRRGLPARRFALRGRCLANGRFEWVDDTPERFPGFRRGLYTGVLDRLGEGLRGQYYELDELTQALFYWGDWTAARQPATGRLPGAARP